MIVSVIARVDIGQKELVCIKDEAIYSVKTDVDSDMYIQPINLNSYISNDTVSIGGKTRGAMGATAPLNNHLKWPSPPMWADRAQYRECVVNVILMKCFFDVILTRINRVYLLISSLRNIPGPLHIEAMDSFCNFIILKLTLIMQPIECSYYTYLSTNLKGNKFHRIIAVSFLRQ